MYKPVPVNGWMFPVRQGVVVGVSELLTLSHKVISAELSPVPLPPTGGRRAGLVRGRSSHLRRDHEPPSLLPVPHHVEVPNPRELRLVRLTPDREDLSLSVPGLAQVRATHCTWF